MELTQEQQETITQLEQELNSGLWEKLYYVEEREELWNLYNQGVELNFSVTVKPYKGFNHPTNKG